MPDSQVITAKVPDYREPEIHAFLESAFALIPPERKIKSGDLVLVKPNFLWPKAVETAVTTHPMVIMETCKILNDLGAKISIGDSPSRGSALMAARKIGIEEPAKKMGVAIINFAQPVTIEVKDPIRFRRLDLARESLGFDHVINLAKLKTHDLMVLTLAVKNMFGCVVGSRKPLYHLETEHNPRAFAELHLEIYRYFSPALSVMDAVVAMEGNGPNSDDPKQVGVMLASPDAVALDSVSGTMVGFPFEYNLHALLGTEHKVGQGNPARIEIIGPPPGDIKCPDFKLPHAGPPESGRITPVVKWIVGDGIVRRPVFDHLKCTRCAACIDTCPTKCLSFAPDRKKIAGFNEKVAIDRNKCIHCFCCQEVCPEGAISSRKSWLARKLLG